MAHKGTQAILLQDVDKLGRKGDVVNVAAGYMRNYLAPRKLALQATDGMVAQVQRQEEMRRRHEAQSDEQAHDIARALGRAGVIHPASLPDQRAFKSALDIRQPKPPLVRNKVIVRETALLVAAPADAMEQHRSGTWSTVRFARKLGRAICVIRPDGTLIPERGKP